MVTLFVLNDALSDEGTETYFVLFAEPRFNALPPGFVERYLGDPQPDCVIVGEGIELIVAVTANLGLDVHPLSVKST